MAQISALARAALALLAVGLAEPAAAIDGGAAPAEPLAQAVVAVQTVRVAAGGQARVHDCTGVLVAPAVVLTAAHCVDEAERPDEVAVFPYSGARPVGSHVVAAAVLRHPRHRADAAARDPGAIQAAFAADIALIRLGAPLAGRTPIPLAAQPAQAPGRIAGVGGGAGRRDAGLLRFAALTTVRRTTSGPPLAFASAVGARVCSGDSGGPVVVDGGDGLRVWGLVGAVFRPEKAGCGARLVIVPTDPAAAEMRSLLGSAGLR